ncbi:hypothetical protein T484DRAFT_1816475 [Baffinella frigidus]|nr:hypothetical protein T484DRAFT_1816475 [Cryptophyta sp. CCMP2293]
MGVSNTRLVAGDAADAAPGGHSLLLFGDDFRFTNASRYFARLDKLLAAARTEGLKAKYSAWLAALKAHVYAAGVAVRAAEAAAALYTPQGVEWGAEQARALGIAQRHAALGLHHDAGPGGAAVRADVTDTVRGRTVWFLASVPPLGVAAFVVEVGGRAVAAEGLGDQQYFAGGGVLGVLKVEDDAQQAGAREGATANSGEVGLRIVQGGGVEVLGAGGRQVATLRFARYVFAEDHFLGWGP